jgi:uncharacterized protein (DUF58 family)
MTVTQEFHYRLRTRIGGHRPGAHPGMSLGAGQEYATHGRLFDTPDPRRIDLRASLRDLRGEWLVRHYRQRAAVAVTAIVDVSASMHFGPHGSKLALATDFVDSMAQSAFHAGDSVGLSAFDSSERIDLFVPPRYGRGMGPAMCDALRRSLASTDSALARGIMKQTAVPGAALSNIASRFAGKNGLIFLLSDFHWPLQNLLPALDLFASAHVIPVVIWDSAEIEPPRGNGLLALQDAESGARRALWLRPRIRDLWRDRVRSRRGEIDALCAERGLRPIYLCGRFNADDVTRYFLEGHD